MKFCPYCSTPLADSDVDGERRLACPAPDCNFVYWNNPLPVVAAIVEYNDTVILARNKAWPEGMFSLITGFLEKGETPEQTAVREVREELGLEGSIAGFVGYYSFFETNQLILAFHVQVDTDAVRLNDELAEYRMIPVDKLKPWPFGTGHAVKDWLAGRK